MAHPVLVHFNQVPSALMSNALGLLSDSRLCLHVHENIHGYISAENPMLFAKRPVKCLPVS